jgi:hypothetical protein
MVKVGKLWGDARFASLSPNSKLLYCYLISQPNITTLGVLVLDINRISLDLKIEVDSIKCCLVELLQKGYIQMVSKGDEATIIILNHYHSLAKSKANIRKAIDEGKSTDGELLAIFRKVYRPEDFTNDSFKAPTPQEVMEYALELGYEVNGKAFVDYYADNDWYDKNNKKVRAWKSKVAKVWCREENKLETAKGSPKGFEYFFVDLEEGVRVFPESWKNDLPSHSNFIYAEHLINKFNERNS